MSLLLFTFLDIEEGGDAGTPAEEVASNRIWRRVLGDTGMGEPILRAAPFGEWEDRTVVSGVHYEYRSQVYGVNGTFNWSPWYAAATADT